MPNFFSPSISKRVAEVAPAVFVLSVFLVMSARNEMVKRMPVTVAAVRNNPAKKNNNSRFMLIGKIPGRLGWLENRRLGG